MRFSIFQDTQIGGRSGNQDRMGYCFTRDALLMVLADGMGGHALGDMAAEIALQSIGGAFQKLALPVLPDPEGFLQESILEAHREILRYRTLHHLPDSPRTTIVVCVVQKGAAWWAHVGDSRLYWLRAGTVVRRTRDHSKMQTLIEQGLATSADLATHPDRNKLYNCLGSPDVPSVEMSGKVFLAPGDALFLCSDGLWASVPDSRIASTFATNTVMRAVPDLIQLALDEAGDTSDNVTGLAMAWEGGSDAVTQDSLIRDSVVSTELLPIGSATTTIQGTEPLQPVPHTDELSDDEIEKAIAEIRESIRKSSQVVPKP